MKSVFSIAMILGIGVIQAATMPPAPKGFFGYEIGQKVDVSKMVKFASTETVCGDGYLIRPKKPFHKGFNQFVLCVTPKSHRVISFCAIADKMQGERPMSLFVSTAEKLERDYRISMRISRRSITNSVTSRMTHLRWSRRPRISGMFPIHVTRQKSRRCASGRCSRSMKPTKPIRRSRRLDLRRCVLGSRRVTRRMTTRPSCPSPRSFRRTSSKRMRNCSVTLTGRSCIWRTDRLFTNTCLFCKYGRRYCHGL